MRIISKSGREALLKEATELLQMLIATEDKVAEEKVAEEKAQVAKEKVAGEPSKRKRLSSRKRVAINVLRNPGKMKKKMEKLGIALAYDGGLWRYPWGNLGFPDINAQPKNSGGNIEAAVRQGKHIITGYENDVYKFSKLRDGLATVKKFVKAGNIDGAMEVWERKVVPNRLYKRKPTARADKMKKAVHDLMTDIYDSLLEGDVRESVKGIDKAYNALDTAESRVSNMKDIFHEQRKMLMGLRKILEKNPAELNNIASIGRPLDTPMDETSISDVMKVRQGPGLIRDIKKAISIGATAIFDYVKANGQQRVVKVIPKKLGKTKTGKPSVMGFDIDRGAVRQYILDSFL